MLADEGRGVSRVAFRALTSRSFWLALGVVNVIAGVVIGLRPGQSQDLTTVTGWCRDWLINGVNPYPGPRFTTNYPPYALVLLSPLLLLPQGILKGCWSLASVALAVAAARLGLKAAPAGWQRLDGVRLSVGCFLAWESVRVSLEVGQFTLLVFVCGMAAVVYKGKVGRGILLGITMIKPQIGAAFLLWALLEGAVAAVLIAALPAAIGTIVFAARLHESLLGAVRVYGDVVRHELVAPAFRQGVLELRPLIRWVITPPAIADAIHLAIVVASLIAVVVAHRRMSPANRSLFLLPLTCLWALMSVYHPNYDQVLLWPAAVALWVWQADAQPKRFGLVAALQLMLVVDIHGLWWKWSGRPTVWPEQGALAFLQHIDRVLVVMLFVALVTISMRWRSTEAPVTLRQIAVPVA